MAAPEGLLISKETGCRHVSKRPVRMRSSQEVRLTLRVIAVAVGLTFLGMCVPNPNPTHYQGLVGAVATNHRSYIPNGSGPFPTVVAIPGCSGVSLNGPATDEGRSGDPADRLFRRHYPKMAERLRDGGFAVVLVDYLGAEGVKNTCAGEIPHVRVGEYVSAALEFAATLPAADTSRLYVIGWSHGGAGVVAWLESLGNRRSPVAGAVAVYPECDTRGPWTTSLPVLILLGEADDIALPERCERIVQALPNGTNAQVRRYARARHGFDLVEGPEVLAIGGGMTVGRDPRASEAAWAEIFAFLRAH